MRRFYHPRTILAYALVGAALVVAQAQDKPKEPKADMVAKVMSALPESAPAKAKKPRKLLVFSRTAGFRHSSIELGAKAIALMGDKTGAYLAHHTEDESIFDPEKLKEFDAVFMMNTTGNCFKAKSGDNSKEDVYKQSLYDFVKSGKGLAGVHSATDTYHQWKEFNMMMGGTFAGHPWHTKVPIKNLEPKHVLNAPFGGDGFEIADEIYQFRADTALPTDRKFLLALDTQMMDVSKGNRKDGLYPISWVAQYDKGRTFYCSLGHREEIYWNPTILKHYLAGIQYVLGDLEADATPTVKK
jgi:type 1 glutamine amidotransferase